MTDRVREKLRILADAAKYDVSCASSGSQRKNSKTGLGNAEGMGICHSYTEDGRCVSLLKVLLTNYCIYDCAYCISRRSNDVRRAAFSVEEIVDLTINLYKRNYIEGLFLSSGIFKNSDYTSERLVRVAKELRTKHQFNGYIHLKMIPGSSKELIIEAGLYADRLSLNLEIPTETELKKLAPEKNHRDALVPMAVLKDEIEGRAKERMRKKPLFAPAGQSTQLIIGATPERDLHILRLSSVLYSQQKLRRVYYSGYLPVSTDNRLPMLSAPPLIRENRLYQADWLLRFYGFKVHEIVNEAFPDLQLDVDPKLAYALRNPHLFPIDVNIAPYEMILRIPGVGVRSAQRIVSSRRFGKVGIEHLKAMGVAWNRAKHYIKHGSPFIKMIEQPGLIKQQILLGERQQLSLF
ncbi:MAG: putative DNA modification/repair radical SAM protein [Chitinophagales bacterium]|nr:putative DNA modification/repair radical SAM protein [Chitinophagales bacterium]